MTTKKGAIATVSDDDTMPVSPSNADKVYRELLKILCVSVPRSLVTYVICLPIGYLIWAKHLPALVLWSWIASISVLSILRALHCYWLNKHIDFPISKLITQHKINILLIALTGTAWGASGISFSKYLDPFNHVLYVMMLSGFCSGTISTMHSCARSFSSFICTSLVALGAWYLVSGDKQMATIGILTLIYSAGLFIVYFGYSRTTIQAIKLRIEQDELNQQLVALNKQLKNTSLTDGLTGIANRRHFDESIANLWQNNRDSSTTSCLLLVDIDHFKKYNDYYGHIEGDACLSRVANVLAQSARDDDIVTRYGGEEFTILLRGADTKQGKEIAQRILLNIANENIEHKASNTAEYVTVSIGVAAMSTANNSTPSELIKKADSGMYKAKQNGRNCVVVES